MPSPPPRDCRDRRSPIWNRARPIRPWPSSSRWRAHLACRSTSFSLRRVPRCASGPSKKSARGNAAGASPSVRLFPGLLYVMDFAPDARLGGTPHLPGTREYFTCLEGRVEIVVAGERYDLHAGDVLAFPGNTPHSYHNPDTRRPASGVSVVILAI